MLKAYRVEVWIYLLKFSNRMEGYERYSSVDGVIMCVCLDEDRI